MNLIINYNQDSKKLRVIHNTIVGDMPFKEFHKFFGECIVQSYGFCTVDLMSKPYDWKYINDPIDYSY